MKKAELITNWRGKNGPFVNRKQLLLVKGFGKKCFEQCAGFVKVDASAHSDSDSTVKKVIGASAISFPFLLMLILVKY